MRFVCSGDFAKIDRNTIEKILQYYGGKVTGAISGKTDYLIKGNIIDSTKLQAARSKKINIMTEQEFNEFFLSKIGANIQDDDFLISLK